MDLGTAKIIFYITSAISLTILLLLIGYFNYRRLHPEKFEEKEPTKKPNKGKKKKKKR